MVIWQRVSPAFGVLIAIGLGLLILGFFLLVPQERRDAVAWLDLAVCASVLLVNFSNLSIIHSDSARAGKGGFNAEIPKLGVLWTADSLYTSLALGGVWMGSRLWVSFRIQTLYQLVLLFGMLLLVTVATKASEHAGRIEVEERRLANSLENLKSAVNDCESAFSRLGVGSTREYSLFREIKDDVRYLSPCDNPEAVSLDAEMASLLRDLSAGMSTSGQNNLNANETLNRCRTVMRLRKQMRQEYKSK